MLQTQNLKHNGDERTKKFVKNIAFIIAGCFISSCGISFFLTPVHIYSSGILGVAQIVRTLLADVGIVFPFEISGIINFCFNIPLFILAYTKISKRFFSLTVLCIAMQTTFLSIIPVPSAPVVHDALASCLAGGFIAGCGTGIMLRAHGSSGGLDIVGVYLSQRNPNFSVGKLSLMVNTCLFIVCAILFNIDTAIYSMIYLVVSTFVIDKVHYQNINMTAMIFTRNKDIVDFITHELHRGVTYWQGVGGYTEKETYVLMTAVSKDEVHFLKHQIKKIDRHAFIIFSEGLSVSGNFLKHL